MLINDTHKEVVKRSLVLAGGGMRVAYQAGVLMALEEEGIVFQHVDGTSGGIFNSAMLASGMEGKAIAEKWRTLKIKNFLSTKNMGEYLQPWKMEGIGDADNIRQKVFPHLGVKASTIRKQNLPVTFNVCNFSDKNVEAIPASEVTEDHLIAGVSLPIFMPALKINGNWYIDAVWIKDANLMEAVKRGAEEIWLVWAIGNYPSYQGGIFNQYVHSIEMSANGALLEEYEQIKLLNRLIERGEAVYGQTKPIRLFVIHPPLPLPLDSDLFFNKINTRELINMGYEHAKGYLQICPESGEALDQDTTKTPDSGDVLSFRGTFRNEIEWEGKPTEVLYHVYFRFSEASGGYQLDLFSSINVVVFKREFPTCNHIVRKKNKNGVIILEAEADVIIFGKAYRLQVEWVLKGAISYILGLEFKKAKILVYTKTGVSPDQMCESALYQSFLSRLKSLYFTHLRMRNGTKGGIKKKYRMISKFMDYEV